MRRHLGAQPARIADPLHDARHVGGAVQHAHFPRHAHVAVHQRLVVADHVLVRLRAAVLDGVRRPPEHVAPERAVEELEEGQDPGGALGRGAGGFAVEEQREEADAEGVALGVESGVGGARGREERRVS